MSIFGKIKDAIFGKKAVAAQPAAPAAPSPVGTALDAATQAMASAAAAPVDVDAILTAEAIASVAATSALPTGLGAAGAAGCAATAFLPKIASLILPKMLIV